MSKWLKFLAGLAAAVLAGWISHGPLGRGVGFVDQMEVSLQQVLANLAIPDVTGRIQREPLARTALLSGPTNRYQRDGEPTLPGIDARVLTVPGLARVEWTNPPS